MSDDSVADVQSLLDFLYFKDYEHDEPTEAERGLSPRFGLHARMYALGFK